MSWRRHPTKAVVCAILATIAISVKSPTGFAEEEIRQLKTSAGLLVVRKAIGRDCGPEATLARTCDALYLDDKVVISEYQLTIGPVFPSKRNPILVHVGTFTGGNACCEESYIFDFTNNPPLKVEGFYFGHEITRTNSGVVFQMLHGEDALGDTLKETYSYELGSGRPVKIRAEPTHFYKASPLESKKYPYEVLDDPIAREPIIKAVGIERFARFRADIGVCEELKTIDNNFFVGSCCMPHNCIFSFAMFVIDKANRLAWAAHGEEENDKRTAQIFGLLTPDDIVPLREIRSWLAQHKIPEGRASFVEVPSNIARLYKKPRKTIAKVEPPAPPPPSTAQDAPAKPVPPQTANGERVAVALEKEGGTFVVPVSINGALTLKFTIDSGASDVSIPADVVITLFRTGTLTHDDFLGAQTYRLADGSTLPSQTFRIRSLKVGDRVLENVTGSIAPISGGLLLGQSFLSRFKSWSIDNERQVLLLN